MALLLFEPQCRVRDERRVGEIGERVPAPQRERTFEDARRDLGPVERGRVPGSVDQRRELAHVEAARAGAELVAPAGVVQDPTVRFHDAAQPGELRRERLRHRGRCIIAPDPVDQGVGTDHRAFVEREERQDRALSPATQMDGRVARHQLEWTEQAEHRTSVVPPHSATRRYSIGPHPLHTGRTRLALLVVLLVRAPALLLDDEGDDTEHRDPGKDDRSDEHPRRLGRFAPPIR